MFNLMRKNPKCHPNRRFWARDMCNSCYKAWWRENNPQKELETRKKAPYETKEEKRKRALVNRYGISLERYNQMHSVQKGKCAICNGTDNTFLCVDHCHKTGKVRGLLCTLCNKGLGHFKDDIKLLKKSITYLYNHG